MLRITASTSSEGAKRYFGGSLTRSDYYIDGQEIAGHWGGEGAARLGLDGEIDQRSYFSLCDNLRPDTGEQLTPRSKDKRRVGYDFTFSVPKTVSVLYELSGDERILDAFRQSVQETMEQLESEMKTRVRVAGKDEDRITGNLAWAEFIHFTSRPVDGVPDPHLHAHCFAFNTTYDAEEGRWKAGQFGDIKRDATYYEAAFDARLAYRLKALGYHAERDKSYSFEIAGLPESMVDRFSRRRNQIEQEAADLGVTDAAGKHRIGGYGREHKAVDKSKTELREEWRSRLSPEECEALRRVMRGESGGGSTVGPAKALRYALAHSFERASTLSEKRVKAEALRHGAGAFLPEALDNTPWDSDVLKREVDGQMFVTSRDILREESKMLRFARDGRACYAPFAANAQLVATITGEQRAAALHVLRSRDWVAGVRGGAGTGKTRMMKATIDAIENDGKTKVFVFAPTSQASRGVLKAEGFESATTTEQLLSDEAYQEQVKGQVLWIDEAGMLGCRDMARLFELAQRQNCRVILSGDNRQHAAVGRGDAFRLLESEAGVQFAELRRIYRQKDARYKKAVEALSKGTARDTATGFALLERMGAIVEAQGEERHRQLVDDYMQALRSKRTALVIAPTHREGDQLTADIREAMKESGRLSRDEHVFLSCAPLHWTEAQRADARQYEAGHVVQFTQGAIGFKRGEKVTVVRQRNGTVNVTREGGREATLPLDQAARFQVYGTHEIGVSRGDTIRITRNGYIGSQGRKPKERLNNGATYTVAGFTARGDLRLSNGWIVPKEYGHLTHGYVDTSQASQGKTADRVFIAVGDDSLKAANRAGWYVAVSRGREQVRVYTEDVEALKAAVQKSSDRLSATEMMHAPARPTLRIPPARLAQERHRRLAHLRAYSPDIGGASSGPATWRDRVAGPSIYGETGHVR